MSGGSETATLAHGEGKSFGVSFFNHFFLGGGGGGRGRGGGVWLFVLFFACLLVIFCSVLFWFGLVCLVFFLFYIVLFRFVLFLEPWELP